MGMDTLPAVLQMLLGFLLQLAELIVSFLISALTLFLQFFRSLVGLAG